MSGTAYTPTPSESDIYAAVRGWLIETLPRLAAVNIIQGQQNRVAAPVDPFATMLIVGRRRIATNDWTYDRQTTRTIVDKVQVTMQIDVFGAATSNEMQAITTLWRDMRAVDYFRTLGVPISPLYTSETRQSGFITSEKQYDDQWAVDLEMQVNITIPVPEQFAESVDVTLIPIDADYPPAGA